MSHAAAVTEAIAVFKRKDSMDKPARLEAVRSLARYGAFSNAQLSRITGASPRNIAPITAKSDYTGGTLDPKALPLIADIIKLKAAGEIDLTLFAAAIDAGSSSVVIGRLTGIPARSVRRYAGRARDAA